MGCKILQDNIIGLQGRTALASLIMPSYEQEPEWVPSSSVPGMGSGTMMRRKKGQFESAITNQTDWYGVYPQPHRFFVFYVRDHTHVVRRGGSVVRCSGAPVLLRFGASSFVWVELPGTPLTIRVRRRQGSAPQRSVQVHGGLLWPAASLLLLGRTMSARENKDMLSRLTCLGCRRGVANFGRAMPAF